MTDDDEPVGHVLARREVLALLGASGLMGLTDWRGSAARAAEGVPRCVARPRQTEGPYFVDAQQNRSDIRSDPSDGSVKPGLPLDLTFAVSRLAGASCVPLAGAVVDLWQCDHFGVYSDVRDPGFDTVGRKFLRGYQVTGGDGQARFTTIYPGWYQGRAVHLHFKIRSAPAEGTGFEFISQLYFDDALTDQVHAQAPYAAKGQRTRRNAADRIFSRGGSELMLDLVGDPAAGYRARFEIALDTA